MRRLAFAAAGLALALSVQSSPAEADGSWSVIVVGGKKPHHVLSTPHYVTPKYGHRFGKGIGVIPHHGVAGFVNRHQDRLSISRQVNRRHHLKPGLHLWGHNLGIRSWRPHQPSKRFILPGRRGPGKRLFFR